MNEQGTSTAVDDPMHVIAHNSFMNLWQGYCDLKQLSRDLMALVEGKCPECGRDDLHSASLGGKRAIHCCECDWTQTYEHFRSLVP